MSEATSRKLINWGNCENKGHRSCQDCRIKESAYHRAALYLKEWARAVDDLAARAREEDDEPELSLIAIQGLAIAMQDFAGAIIVNTRQELVTMAREEAS